MENAVKETTKEEFERQAKEQGKDIVEMTEENFQAQIAKAQQEQQTQGAEATARLNRLLAGEEEPKNEFVKYLVERVRAGTEEYKVVQSNLQELSNRVAQLQKRAIQIQGIQDEYAQSIVQWWDRDTKLTGDDTPAKEDENG